tara:strand:+ start:9636 stop:10676 length:1041 start_codon:yes stop_codon:yes gene_type:complete
MTGLELLAIQAGIQGIGALADRRRTRKQQEAQQPLLDQARQDVQSAFGSLADIKYTVSESEKQLAKTGMRPTDLSPIAAQQATALETLATDPRALMGAVPGLTQATQQATTAAQQADLSRELAAEGRLAGLEQAALTGNVDLQRNLEQLKLQRAMGSEATAAQNLAMLEAQRGSIGPSMVQGLTQTGTSLASSGLDGTSIGGGPGSFFSFPNTTPPPPPPGFIPNVGSAIEFTGGFAEEGGKIKYGHGGEMKEDVMMAILQDSKQPPVQKLGGEFNHGTNKKAIVDEETGEKEAEATGGEFIINPEQSSGLQEAYAMINKEEPTYEQLLELFKAAKFLEEPQFNEA